MTNNYTLTTREVATMTSSHYNLIFYYIRKGKIPKDMFINPTHKGGARLFKEEVVEFINEMKYKRNV